jgi:glutamate synthase (NADPH/NADH) small chain
VAAVFGEDPRAYCVMSTSFTGAADGRLTGVKTVQIEWAGNGNGRSAARAIAGTERDWPAQLVLLAMGFLGPETDGLLSQLGVAIDERGNVRISEDKMTSVPGVFAAGDMARGQSLVVWAIADGRRAAKGVDGYLKGSEISDFRCQISDLRSEISDLSSKGTK